MKLQIKCLVLDIMQLTLQTAFNNILQISFNPVDSVKDCSWYLTVSVLFMKYCSMLCKVLHQ